VLDKDIFTVDANEIKDIKVEKTMIDGEFVYERLQRNDKVVSFFIVILIKYSNN